jgi:hypothetical protein
MNSCGRFLTAGGLVFIALLLGVIPAWAQSEEIEEQIRALEKEVAKIEPLKEQIERLRTHQLELRKEATTAAAALPTFEYRPARGMTIAAADKSWSFNMSYRLDQFMYFFPDSPEVIDQTAGAGTSFARTRRASGQLHPRRNRLYMTYCWVDCFYEVNLSLDGEGSFRDRRRLAQFRDTKVAFHFEQWNPFLPSFVVGVRVDNQIYLGRSSSSDVKTEHNWGCDSISTTCTGSSNSIGLQWEEVPAGPGEVALHAMYHTRGVGITQDEERDTERKGLSSWLGYQPFSKIKNKWIQGLELGFGWHMNRIDSRANLIPDPSASSANAGAEEPNAMEVFTHEDRGDVTLIEAGDIGKGPLHYFSPGIRWRIGPYQIRAIWAKADFRGKRDDFRGVGIRSWEIAQQIFLWSPKGVLTGSYNTPGSVHFGWAFERADARCARTLAALVSAGGDCSPAAGNFNSNAILNRELGVFVAIRPGIRAGYSWNWWQSDNTPVRSQVATGCKDDIESAQAGKGAGRGCNWHTHSLLLQTRW